MPARNPFFLSGAAFLFALALMAAVLASAAEVPWMTRETLKARLGQAGLIILDVRMAEEWESTDAKIKGAIWENPRDYLVWAGKYPKDRMIVLYCA